MKSLGNLLLASVAFLPAMAQAQDAPSGIEDIVVTAQKRAENLQDTPIAITAFTADSLANMGTSNVSDLARNTPSLYAAPYPSSSNTVTLYIRGLGVNDPMQITKDGAVGVYVDGFYMSRPQTSTVDLADVERVEILRGPQGTLYGRNTTGGAVNIVSRKPTGEFGVRQTLTLGNYDHVRSLTNIDLPAVGDFAVKLTFLGSARDGWARNPRGNDFNKESQMAGRAAVRWTPSSDVTVDYAFDKGRVESTPIYYVNDSLVGVYPGYTADPKRPYREFDLPESVTEFEGHSLTGEWQASNDLTLRLLLGMRDLDFLAVQDYAEAFGVPFRSRDVLDSRQYTAELQAVGSLGDRIDYVAGLYYFREKVGHPQYVSILDGAIENNRDVNARARSLAAYTQVTWTPDMLDDRLALTLGARYTNDRRSATRDLTSVFHAAPGVDVDLRPREDGISNAQKFSRFNPSFTANFRATEDVTAYAKVSTGYRAGGSNESGMDFTRTFGPEKVINYEVGLKTDLFDRRARINLAAFMLDYKALQLDTSPSETDRSITDTINAGNAKIKGFEAEVTLAPVRDFTITGSYSFLDAKLRDIYVTPGSTFDPNISPLAASMGFQIGDDVSDRYVLSFAPRHSYSIAGDWTFLRNDNGNFAAHVDYVWKDYAYTTAGAGSAVPGHEIYRIPAYGLLGARLTYTHELSDDRNVRFSIWGRNITDKRYKSHVVGNGDIVQGYFSTAYSMGTPATYGIEFGFDL
ncbi:TonB-dependent receptor [Sphingomonas sp. C3-2]|uniref:TonB-dependent receptor n=1 Tax=Sphingomonas sp. C3-2 TaxID=3062169 RepID=UPI00294AF0B0|nr:TonB-dependent receptor [Sphingomonas sp. C3-2]WOK36198.1 TonB-dependent receptor [Sphingomonas sp. C3-2]